ncbi:hypothetical protein TrLO_g12 [Triparma laevis f. longispina]|nr:hypothetical protein TrLO_g12 [Triparma laevis f. longispina]
MYTPEFTKHFVEFVYIETLMVLRLSTKEWNAAVDALINKGVKSGELMVHGGNDISNLAAYARKARRELVTRVVFLLNITKVGKRACYYTVNLVVVDIPEGVESIGYRAFSDCRKLTTVSFPTTLTSIGAIAFNECSCLDTVDLLHTNLQKLGVEAFNRNPCSELRSTTIPDSLQTLGGHIFHGCSKLVPSDISTDDKNTIISYLRSKQNPKTKFIFYM